MRKIIYILFIFLLLSVIEINIILSSDPSFEVAPSPNPLIQNTAVLPTSGSLNTLFIITSQVSDVSGIGSAIAHIQNPDETDVALVTLYDDGLHSDGAANDNIYGNTWDSTGRLIGTYFVDIIANDNLGYFSEDENGATFNIMVCVPSLTCLDYSGQCGTNLWDGCSNSLDCSGACVPSEICCSDVCQTLICNGPNDCKDGNDCTADICSNAGTCTASCSNIAIIVCMDNDNCCPAGCDSTTDNDCCVPTLTCAVDYSGQCGTNLWDGCSNSLDCSGACIAPQICCAGTCRNPVCNNNADCDDSDSCTGPDSCSNSGTCIASCSNPSVACINGDGCCPLSCDSTTDNDCIALPTSFDWSHKELPGALPAGGADWMSPVRNQGSCGSCWAFSAIGAVEGQYNIEQNNPTLDINLAERYLVSTCCSAGTCSGGWPKSALIYMRDSGITEESCFPYKASNVACSSRCAAWSTNLWKIGNYVDKGWVGGRDEIKKIIVNHGPVSAYIKMGGRGKSPNHAIVIVGYDDARSQWIVRNSWGAGYSGNGYFKVGYGQMLIESWGVHYVVGVTPP